MSKRRWDCGKFAIVEDWRGDFAIVEDWRGDRVFNDDDEEERYQAFKDRLKEENERAVHRGEE